MKHSIFFLFLLFCLQSKAQEALSAGSRSGSIGDIQIDWTVGEMTAVNTAQNASLIVTQGFHQPFFGTISTATLAFPDGSLAIFPNPVTIDLQLKSQFETEMELNVTVFDALGKQVMDTRLSLSAGENISPLSFRNFPAGVYYLHCYSMKEKQGATFVVTKVTQ